jgi:hypothetical protein
MLNVVFTRHSTSPFSNHVILVKKKDEDGSFALVNDI